jgi:hypothetical protein
MLDHPLPTVGSFLYIIDFKVVFLMMSIQLPIFCEQIIAYLSKETVLLMSNLWQARKTGTQIDFGTTEPIKFVAFCSFIQ